MPEVVMGVDVGGTGTKGALVNREGELLHRAELATDPSAGTKGIIDIVDQLLEAASTRGDDVAAVGVGVAGFVDTGGTVTFSPNLIYDDPHIAEVVSQRTNVPVVVDNDANAAAWGERRYGVAQGCDHVVLLTVGTGIGSGFIVNGALLRGSTGAGAEAGHVVFDPSEVECGCGLRGCFEQLASGRAIERMARKAVADDPQSSILSFASSAEEVTAEDVAHAARQLDETARVILRKAGRALGSGLCNLVNLFDPEVIVLAGSVIGAGEPFLGPARDALAELTTKQRRRPQRLLVSSLKGDGGIVGAGALAWDLLESPQATT